METNGLPGDDLVRRGIEDLRAGRDTIESLLVEVGAPRLRRIGLALPATEAHAPEHRLYDRLAAIDAAAAHATYNALIRRLVSFERAAECAFASTANDSTR